MTTGSPTTPGVGIPIASVPNLRDLGGWATRDGGRVRSRVLYRSAELARLGGADMEAFIKLGIRSVYDMRTDAERQTHPDHVPGGIQQIVLDVLKDSADAAPAQLLAVLQDPQAAQQMLGGGKAAALFERGYREIVSLPSALSA